MSSCYLLLLVGLRNVITVLIKLKESEKKCIDVRGPSTYLSEQARSCWEVPNELRGGDE